jgi:hypothetical protein
LRRDGGRGVLVGLQLAWHFAGKPAPTRQVVVIDAARVAEARVRQALSKPGLGADAAAGEGTAVVRLAGVGRQSAGR